MLDHSLQAVARSAAAFGPGSHLRRRKVGESGEVDLLRQREGAGELAARVVGAEDGEGEDFGEVGEVGAVGEEGGGGVGVGVGGRGTTGTAFGGVVVEEVFVDFFPDAGGGEAVVVEVEVRDPGAVGLGRRAASAGGAFARLVGFELAEFFDLVVRGVASVAPVQADEVEEPVDQLGGVVLGVNGTS